MIVLGADMHKSSHTIAAVAAGTGELVGDRTVNVGKRGFGSALAWARELGGERVWALEDCRHVPGAFERFLLGRGERVVRVTSRLMAGERRVGRERGKSDRIDAIAIARAALREGPDRCRKCWVDLGGKHDGLAAGDDDGVFGVRGHRAIGSADGPPVARETDGAGARGDDGFDGEHEPGRQWL
jgi:hypothetical protein